MPDLLIELFSEEIPARMQARAADDLKRLITNGLVEAGLTYAGAGAFSTPRRLTLSVEDLLAQSPAVREERKGPKVGAPDQAVDGFARSAGVARAALETRDTGKGEAYFAVIEQPGRAAVEVVAEVLEKTIRSFPWPKSMRWGTGSLKWVRPLQRILCILTDEAGASVVPLTVDDLESGDVTSGHRFLAPKTFSVTSFDAYEAKLKQAHVYLRADERRDLILAEATAQAFAKGLELVPDEGLLTEIAGLVEWPVVLMGNIGADYLDLPSEVLQTSMREHQKFLSVRNPKTSRIEGFVTVANTETADGGATILQGNERVLSARLADAKFFWENDLRVARAGMKPWLDSLGAVTFHNKLGSVRERIDRFSALARKIAPVVGAPPDLAEQAGQIAKADLSSEMVNEFPELQGVMGRYYSASAGLPGDVSAACEEHYAPLGPSDDVPTAPVSVAVALAEKLDVLSGFWSIGETPTGSKDPFALRRAALGVIRIVLEGKLRFPLRAYFETPEADSLLSFFHDRLKVHLKNEGLRHDVIDACLEMPGNDDLTLLVARARALQAFLDTEDGENLMPAFLRANNILTQAEEKDGVEYSYGADRKFAEVDAETALFDALDVAEVKIAEAQGAEDFSAAMASLADLRGPIDGFFDAVQINAESQVLRRNRLNLLSRIRTICLSVANLTQLRG